MNQENNAHTLNIGNQVKEEKKLIKGHPCFDQLRESEKDSNDADDSAPFKAFQRWFVSFDLAARDLGVPADALIELAYQRKIFLLFHRPTGVSVRRIAEYVQRYDDAPRFVQPDFLVLPSYGCFDLHFNDQVDLWDVSLAMSFSPTRGLSTVALSPNRPSSDEPLGKDLYFSLNARQEDWAAAWGSWGFLRNGVRSQVQISKKDLFLPVEELELARLIISESVGGDVVSYHSQYLQAMIEASRTLWIDSGAAMNLSANPPGNEEIEKWLIERTGMAPTLAERAATLIRPREARKGRPPGVQRGP